MAHAQSSRGVSCRVVGSRSRAGRRVGLRGAQIHHGPRDRAAAAARSVRSSRRNRAFVVERAIDPDLWRTAGWEEEAPRHFVDLDAYGPYPFKDLPHDYDEAVQKHGQDFVLKNGTLPWRTEEIYKKLVEAFQQKAGFSRDNIKFFSARRRPLRRRRPRAVPRRAELRRTAHAAVGDPLAVRVRAVRAESPPAPRHPRSRSSPVEQSARLHLLGADFRISVRRDRSSRPTARRWSGREVYDDQYFALMFAQRAAGARTAAGRIDHRRRVDDHGGVDRGGPSCPSRAGAAAAAEEGAASVTTTPVFGSGRRRSISRSTGPRSTSTTSATTVGDDGHPVFAAAYRDADRGVDPDHRGGRQPLNIERRSA